MVLDSEGYHTGVTCHIAATPRLNLVAVITEDDMAAAMQLTSGAAAATTSAEGTLTNEQASVPGLSAGVGLEALGIATRAGSGPGSDGAAAAPPAVPSTVGGGQAGRKKRARAEVEAEEAEEADGDGGAEATAMGGGESAQATKSLQASMASAAAALLQVHDLPCKLLLCRHLLRARGFVSCELAAASAKTPWPHVVAQWAVMAACSVAVTVWREAGEGEGGGGRWRAVVLASDTSSGGSHAVEVQPEAARSVDAIVASVARSAVALAYQFTGVAAVRTAAAGTAVSASVEGGVAPTLVLRAATEGEDEGATANAVALRFTCAGAAGCKGTVHGVGEFVVDAAGTSGAFKAAAAEIAAVANGKSPGGTDGGQVTLDSLREHPRGIVIAAKLLSTLAPMLVTVHKACQAHPAANMQVSMHNGTAMGITFGTRHCVVVRPHRSAFAISAATGLWTPLPVSLPTLAKPASVGTRRASSNAPPPKPGGVAIVPDTDAMASLLGKLAEALTS